MTIYSFDRVQPTIISESARFAEDLDWPSRVDVNFGYEIVNIDPSSGLTTALSLTGSYLVPLLALDNMTAESHTIKLTIDGEVVWNDTLVTGTVLPLVGYGDSSNIKNGANDGQIVCETSLLLEVQSTTDTSEDLYFIARPIK